ncbi:outer membrane receptor protein involved in Fe transport [Novosphingobium sp. SG751A]|uniref:TonB-dependent receptor domain-containing protein n=1 Tax=Novosphingobium sp. SG751A TaxID=2587000 RepID=UPI001556EB2E|nr:TonB-dependent receptor [Novosphingobium sp. SG751A]NOW46701.1 outer membrane receptor protein involved in Fe transport [Novosphingobium sp. SG751A]
MLAVIACPLPGAEAKAQPEASGRKIEIPSLALAEALEVLVRQTGLSIGVDGNLPNIRTPSVHKAHGAADALARLLNGTGLEARQVGGNAWRIVRQKAPPPRPVSRFAPAVEAGEGSTIVVTGTKQNASLFSIPQSLSVLALTPHDRYDPNRDTGYVASEVEGLNLTALGPGRNRMFLRGVADSPFNDSNQSPVAVVLDETRLTYSAPAPDLRLVDVERVELLKGPQGTLYGLGTLGGVFHIVTAKADVEKFTGSVSAGLNFTMHGTFGENGSVIVNTPIVPGRIALRLVGYESHEPGWIDTGNRPNGNFSVTRGGRASLGVELGEGWRADLGAMTQHINTSDSQYTYTEGSFWRPSQLAEPHDSNIDHYSARLVGKLGSVKAVVLGGYTEQNVSDTFEATIGADAFGLADPSLFRDVRSYRLVDAEVRLNGALGRAGWLLGLAYMAARERGSRTLSSFDPISPMTIDYALRKTEETGAFGQINLPLTGRLGLEIGGRVYHGEQSGDFTGGIQTLTRWARQWAFTPSAALSWHITDRLLYIHYGTANRPGAMDFSWRGKVKQLADDGVRTLELGWREKFANGGSFEADGFITWWHDIQTDHVLPNGLIVTHNVGQARIVGAEATLDLPLRYGWHLATGVTVQNAEVVETNSFIANMYGKLPTIPMLTLRGSMDHDFRVGPISANVKLSLRYLGSESLSFDPALNRPMGDVLESRLEAGVDWGRSHFDLKLANLLNRLDNRFAYGNPFRLGIPQYTPQRPFNASIAITRSF